MYVPVGEEVKDDPAAYNAKLMPTSTEGIYNIYYNQGLEAALTGADIEAGHEVPGLKGLMTYVGAYGYPKAHGVDSRVGPLARVEYNLSDAGFLGDHPLMDSTVIEGFVRHDAFAGTNYYVGLKFGLNLDGTPRYKMNPLQRHMVDPVWKDMDVITATDAKKNPILLTNAQGTPLTVAVASDYQQLQHYLQQNINVIGINGTITIPNPVQNAKNPIISSALTLHDGQALTGGVYDFLPGRIVAVAHQGALVSHANNQTLIGVGKNNTIEHLRMHMTGLNFINGNVNFAVSNYTNANPENGHSVGRLTLAHNIFDNSGINLSMADGSKDSILNIVDNKLTLTNLDTYKISEGINFTDIAALQLTAMHDTNFRLEHLDNNQITLSLKPVLNAITAEGISVRLEDRHAHLDKSTLFLDSMQYNQITVSSPKTNNTEFNSATYEAISLGANDNGVINASHLSNNLITMNIMDANSSASGLNVNATRLEVQDVSNDTILLNGVSHTAFLMSFGGLEELNLSHVTHNVLTANPLTKRPHVGREYKYTGISAGSDKSGATSIITEISTNYIVLPVSGGRDVSAGIDLRLSKSSGLLKVTDVLNNRISFKPYDDGTGAVDGVFSAGIYMGSNGCNHSPENSTLTLQHISGNIIEMTALNIKNAPDPKHPDKSNDFYGIDIETRSADKGVLNNVNSTVTDISNNQISIHATGAAGRVRGIIVDTDGMSTVQDVVHNAIYLNAPQGADVVGILYQNAHGGIINSYNTSFNQLTVIGRDLVAGIKFYNTSGRSEEHSGIYSNQMRLSNTFSNAVGIYYIADNTFQGKHGLEAGAITSKGIESNQISFDSQGTGIFAWAKLPKNKITLIAVPNHPAIGPSAANGQTRYRTKGNVTPKA